MPWGCWKWLGELSRNGYGRVWDKEAKKKRAAHRVIWEKLVGPIHDEMLLDHVKVRGCHMRACCYPGHLEPVTPRENTLRDSATLFKKKT